MIKKASSPLLGLSVMFCGYTGTAEVATSEDRQNINWETLALDTSSNHREVPCRQIAAERPVCQQDEEQARIEVSLDDLRQQVRSQAEANPHLTADAELAQRIEAMEGDFDLSQLEAPLLKRAQRAVKTLLLGGQARVFNKERQRYETSIIAADYEYSLGPLTAGGGKIFLFKGSEAVFLEAQEWAS
ncbi:MAG: hypothetical protein E1N59_1572 [Puniceicoccaceae bacterium 5H]|nr:MAG: hypothetical protein E1N59_1572 [Puniceicoccaceae bacterium 5H]